MLIQESPCILQSETTNVHYYLPDPLEGQRVIHFMTHTNTRAHIQTVTQLMHKNTIIKGGRHLLRHCARVGTAIVPRGNRSLGCESSNGCFQNRRRRDPL